MLPDPEGPFFHMIAEGADDERAGALADEYVEVVTSLQ